MSSVSRGSQILEGGGQIGNKVLICLESKSMAPRLGNFFFRSSQQLPRLHHGTLRAFWAHTTTFRGSQLAWCIAHGNTLNQWHRQVCCVRHGGSRTPSRKSEPNLDFALHWQNTLLFVVPKLGKAQAPCPPPLNICLHGTWIKYEPFEYIPAPNPHSFGDKVDQREDGENNPQRHWPNDGRTRETHFLLTPLKRRNF